METRLQKRLKLADSVNVENSNVLVEVEKQDSRKPKRSKPPAKSNFKGLSTKNNLDNCTKLQQPSEKISASRPTEFKAEDSRKRNRLKTPEKSNKKLRTNEVIEKNCEPEQARCSPGTRPTRLIQNKNEPPVFTKLAREGSARRRQQIMEYNQFVNSRKPALLRPSSPKLGSPIPESIFDLKIPSPKNPRTKSTSKPTPRMDCMNIKTAEYKLKYKSRCLHSDKLKGIDKL